MSVRSQFDPERSWQSLEERIEIEKDPRCRQLLEQVRDHMRTEIRGEFEALMATLVDDPQYHLWGMGAEMGPKGREAVATFYTDMIATGGNHFEFEIRRIVVDHDAVVTEGVLRTLMPGAAVIASGISEVSGAAWTPMPATYRRTRSSRSGRPPRMGASGARTSTSVALYCHLSSCSWSRPPHRPWASRSAAVTRAASWRWPDEYTDLPGQEASRERRERNHRVRPRPADHRTGAPAVPRPVALAPCPGRAGLGEQARDQVYARHDSET